MYKLLKSLNVFPAPALSSRHILIWQLKELNILDSSLWRLQRPETFLQRLPSLPTLLFTFNLTLLDISQSLEEAMLVLLYSRRDSQPLHHQVKHMTYITHMHRVVELPCHRPGMTTYVGHPFPIYCQRLADNAHLLIKYLCCSVATW